MQAIKTKLKRNKLSLGIASIMAMSIAGSAMAEDKNSENFKLDILKKPIISALLDLSDAAGIQIMIGEDVNKKIEVPGIKGSYQLVEALDLMLKGSGLTYEFISDSSIVVSEEEGGESAENDEEGDVDEEIVVTGSRLIQEPGKLTRQVTTISREELEASGVSRLDEYLRRLPQNVNAPSSVASGGFENGATFGRGINAFAGSGVNLRGLGEQYTLVLIDGRRPAKGGLFGDVVDISTIPVSQVERVEILFDGAAAIYGADAVGGVINIITNREYSGTEVSLEVSETQGGGGEELNFNIGHTFSWGDGNLTVNGSYQTRKEVDGADRSIQFVSLPRTFGLNGIAQYTDGFTLFPSVPANIGTDVSFLNSGQVLMYVSDVDGDGRTDNESLNERIRGAQLVPHPFVPGVMIRQPTIPPAGYIPVLSLQLPETTADPDALSLYDIVEDTSAPLPAADASPEEILAAMRARFPLGENTFRAREGVSLSPKDDLFSVSASVNHAFTENFSVDLTGRYSKSDRESSTRNNLSQQAIFASRDANPFGSTFFLNYTDDLPQTNQDVEVETMSISGGFDYDFHEDWNLRFGFSLSENDSRSNQVNAVNQAELSRALSGSDFVSGVGFVPNGLGFFKPLFGHASTEEYLSALIVPMIRTRTETASRDYDLNLTGVVAKLPAGDMRTNIILTRSESTTDTRSEQFNDLELVSPDQRTADTRFDLESEEARTGLGIELAAPVTKTLLANANARYEKYDGIDDTAVNWAGGLNWSPVDWMTVRFNRTYSVTVPSSIISSTETRLVPDTYTLRDENRQFLPGFPSIDTYELYGGNPSLRPERNYGTTLGFIFRPLEGLDIQLNLTESDTYDQVNDPSIFTFYTQRELEPDAVAANPILHRVENGMLNIDGQIFTETSATAGNFPAPLVEGTLVFDNRDVNVADTLSRSADLQIRYNLNTEFGDWLVNFTHQYLADYEVQPIEFCGGNTFCEEFVDPFDQVGLIDTRNQATIGFNPLPEHRSSIDLTWSYRGLSANLFTSIQSDTDRLETDRQVQFTGGAIVFLNNLNRITTKAATSVTLNLGYDFSGDLFDVPKWLESTRVNLQVANLFQSRSSVSRTVLEQEFDPGEFDTVQNFSPFGVDPFGRTLRLRLTSSF